MARRRGVELESGFTLIELLIVIVVLGILAATVIFALTGITSQSAAAACQSDAKTYEVAVAAYENSPENSTNAVPTTTNQLLNGIGTSGAFLHQAANNTSYVVALSGDTVTGPSTGVKNGTATTSLTGTPADGTVMVGPPSTALVNYDGEAGSGPSGTGCNDPAL